MNASPSIASAGRPVKPLPNRQRSYPRFWMAEIFLISLSFNNITIGPTTITIYAGAALILLELPYMIKYVINKHKWIDYIVVLYLLLAFANIQIDNTQPFLKTVAYVAAFYAFRSNLDRSTEPLKVLKIGAIIGAHTFIALFVYAAWQGGVTLQDLLNFSYDRVTYVVFRELLSQGDFGQFESRLVLRSTIAEAQALYFSILFLTSSVALGAAPVISVMLLQSRRAALALLIVAFFSDNVSRTRLILFLIVCTPLYFFALYNFLDDVSTRFSNFTDAARLTQYGEALEQIGYEPIWGFGYAEKLGEIYVHNFFLASWYMMGFAGLLLSVIFAVAVLSQAQGTGRLWALSVFPLLEMLVGSAVEGMLTFSSWVAISILMVARDRASGRSSVQRAIRSK